MNKATKKLDHTITNWRAWCEDMEMDLGKIDHMDEESIAKVIKQVDKIKSLLNQRGFNSTYIKHLPKREKDVK